MLQYIDNILQENIRANKIVEGQFDDAIFVSLTLLTGRILELL